MRIILSPAKTMREQPRRDLALPRFLNQTEHILSAIKSKTPEELKRIWKCNDALTALNARRVREMDLYENLTPAIESYEGIAYQHMAPHSLQAEDLDYLQVHLRILSGFYGLLCPMDGVTPYRLEMGAKLEVNGCRDLYAFWSDSLAKALESETDVILNLASKEYSQAVSRHLHSDTKFLTVRFAEHIGGKTVEKGTLCKMARGEMVNWMAQNQVVTTEELIEFDRLGYRFSPFESDRNLFTFIKE